MEIITWNISIKQILEDHRTNFCKLFGKQIREYTFEVVSKVLLCWDPVSWFASYKCDCCNKIKHIPFSCKSRFCNSCGKPQSDLRTTKLMSRRPKHLKYYHLAFTIPEELRDFFKRHRNALHMLQHTANESLLYFFAQKYKCIPWILSVIHTFWAKTNRNPHIHIMITSWGLTKNNIYKSVSFLPFKWIIVSWQSYLIKYLKRRANENLSWNKLIDELRFLNSFFKMKDQNWGIKSWYVYFSPKADNFEIVLSYIGRYLKRPIISQSRILSYDGSTITFSYKDKYDNTTKILTMSATDFIWCLIQHIPNKFFKMVSYSGIFANRCKSKYLNIINTYYNDSPKMPYIPGNFRDRITLLSGIDPLKCSCLGFFHLYQIVIPGYPTRYFDTS